MLSGRKEYLLKPWDIILSEISDVLEDEKINIPQIWEDIISRVFPQFHKKKDNDNDIKYIESIGNVKYEIISDILIYILKRIIEKKRLFLYLKIFSGWIMKACLF